MGKSLLYPAKVPSNLKVPGLQTGYFMIRSKNSSLVLRTHPHQALSYSLEEDAEMKIEVSCMSELTRAGTDSCSRSAGTGKCLPATLCSVRSGVVVAWALELGRLILALTCSVILSKSLNLSVLSSLIWGRYYLLHIGHSEAVMD